MQNVLILFGNPLDTEAFDRHFESNFRELLHSVPKVEQITLNQIAGSAHGDSPYYLIVELRFGSDDAMQEGLNSDAGQAMATNLSEFATGGFSVLFAQAEVESVGSITKTK